MSLSPPRFLPSLCRACSRGRVLCANWQTRQASSNTNSSTSQTQSPNQKVDTTQAESNPPKKHKTQSQLDEELRQKMAGMSGDGGEAGIEYEDGQPVSMKRSVKNNMFRYI